METVEILTKNKFETMEIGEKISKFLFPNSVILLTGDLGAGKTTFTQGVANGLGIKEKIISPTFNILKCYFNDKLNLYHIDAYRLENNNLDIGLDEFIDGDGTCLIEWPNYIKSLLPSECLEVKIINIGEDSRKLIISANSEKYSGIVDFLIKGE